MADNSKAHCGCLGRWIGELENRGGWESLAHSVRLEQLRGTKELDYGACHVRRRYLTGRGGGI